MAHELLRARKSTYDREPHMTLLSIATGLLLFLNSCVAFLLFLYAINCYVMIFLHRRSSKRMLQHDQMVLEKWQTQPQELPYVTVQLPIYNERYVVKRLLNAVACLHYPKDLLEIQVLDDSTDETTAIAARLVKRYCRQGFNMVLLHRSHRQGYKAGALKEGLEVAKGSFIAIFDADFVPTPDFLQRTLPFFQEPDIGMVQTRWEHINRDYSTLTRAQAFGINGHFWVEQAARCWSGLFMNFNGSGGIWRRQAIEAAGGWQADTLTEDLDLSYRAQLKGWRLKFLPQIVCPSEIPVQMSAVKSQQHRWAKGSIQTAKKLIPQILQADLPLFKKYQALCHLTNYMVHPLIVFVVLMSSLTFMLPSAALPGMHPLIALCFLMATFAPSSMYLYAHYHLYGDWKRRLWAFPFLLIFGTGIALNNTKAILEAVFNVPSGFVRTPKFRIERVSDTWVGRHYHAPFPWLSIGEALLALYCVFGMIYGLRYGASLMNPFHLLFTVSFIWVASLSFVEAWHKWQPHRHDKQGLRAEATPLAKRRLTRGKVKRV
jgi:cellulose synthase/poly-beta-1,6-N-acetylglucosamine synthase-like glycosyltransferase